MGKTVLILEDNENSCEMLKKILLTIDIETKIESSTNLEQAYACALKQNIDLFLVDIVLSPKSKGDISGIKFVENMRNLKQYEYSPIIFVTSIEDPKLYAYSDLHCYSYIEKPFDVKKTEKIIRDVFRMPRIQFNNQSVYFRKNGILLKKDLDNITYIENSRLSRVVHAIDGDITLSYLPCKDILIELGDKCFVRCNRFTIINTHHIEYIDKANHYVKLFKVQKPIEIGEKYYKEF